MNQIEVAKQAIRSEINNLRQQLARLEGALSQLDGSPRQNGSVASAAPKASTGTGKRRGRPRKNLEPEAGDVSVALDLIQEAGNKGVNAIALAHLLKKAGKARPSKTELLDSGKIKVKGNGGGTTYVFAA